MKDANVKRVYKDKMATSINYGDYIIDADKRMVFEKDREIKMTTLEFDLLILFLKSHT